LADDDKAHQKRLKEARKVLEKSYKLYQDGKIDQDELKERLRPYKAELVELNLVKASKSDQTAEDKPVEAPKAPEAKPASPPAESVEKVEVPLSVRGRPWSRRSNLTLDEVRRRVDQLGSTGPSDGLKESYRSRYGEDLAPPLESVTFQVAGPAQPEQAPAPDPQPEQSPAPQPISDRSKGFLKSLFNKKGT
jgi:hypothetical protein